MTKFSLKDFNEKYIVDPANNMKNARQKRGLSQAQMAKLVHTTQPTYSRIETGAVTQPLDDEIISRISTVLGISPRRLREKVRI